jgi:hypothetical protein
MNNDYSLTIPGFGVTAPVTLDLSKTKVAEDRLPEAEHVNAANYNSLEYCFNDSYRELRKVISKIAYEITRANKILKAARSEALLDKYPDFLVEHVKKFPNGLKAKDIDNKDTREAFLNKDANVIAAQDRIDMLTAMLAIYDGKIRHLEKTCSYMKKEMDMNIRGGTIR